jgi:plasmid maintenance system killer protein
MTLQEIKQAIAEGKTVHWSNELYTVIKDSKDQYLIKCNNDYCIGLTWQDETTMNGEEQDFYTA